MSFWTQRHFTALNLIEACRSYNALVQPLAADKGRNGGESPGAERKPTPGKASPGRSADLGDLIR
jgi:hypothetical protein